MLIKLFETCALKPFVVQVSSVGIYNNMFFFAEARFEKFLSF